MVDNADIPAIDLSPEELANLRANLGLSDGPAEDTPQVFPQPKRRRGRPRKHPISKTGTTVPGLTDEMLESEGTFKPPIADTPAKLTKREEREVAERLQKILTGATGIGASIKPYLAMTDQEASDIAQPLASYLIRNADTLPVANQILENYDLAAILFATLAYVVRVYSDRRAEIESSRPARASSQQPQRSLMDRVAENQVGSNGRQQEQGSNVVVSTPYESGDGI